MVKESEKFPQSCLAETQFKRYVDVITPTGVQKFCFVEAVCQKDHVIFGVENLPPKQLLAETERMARRNSEGALRVLKGQGCHLAQVRKNPRK